jgi:hypothetical protein
MTYWIPCSFLISGWLKNSSNASKLFRNVFTVSRNTQSYPENRIISVCGHPNQPLRILKLGRPRAERLRSSSMVKNLDFLNSLKSGLPSFGTDLRNPPIRKWVSAITKRPWEYCCLRQWITSSFGTGSIRWLVDGRTYETDHRKGLKIASGQDSGSLVFAQSNGIPLYAFSLISLMNISTRYSEKKVS